MFPHKPGTGGPASFQKRITSILLKNEYDLMYPKENSHPDIIFIVGSTAKFFWLLNRKFYGAKILYRLDGKNWLHKKNGNGWSLRNKIKAEIINFYSKIIHDYLADYIVYQSDFVLRLWNKGKTKTKYSIIHNGVSLEEFRPNPKSFRNIKLMCLEGYIDYTPYAIELLNDLSKFLKSKCDIIVYGKIRWDKNKTNLTKDIDYKGEINFIDVPKAYSDCIYLSLDINAACPNTVIEALASGIPVVGFDTGALTELVSEEAGIIVPYGSDPWELAYPDVKKLADAILTILDNYESFSRGARKLAESKYDINLMTEEYIKVIKKIIK